MSDISSKLARYAVSLSIVFVAALCLAGAYLVAFDFNISDSVLLVAERVSKVLLTVSLIVISVVLAILAYVVTFNKL